jgi:hypothetical protein
MGIMVLTPPRRKTQQRSLATVAVQSGGAPAPVRSSRWPCSRPRRENERMSIGETRRARNDRLQGVVPTGAACPREGFLGGDPGRSWRRGGVFRRLSGLGSELGGALGSQGGGGCYGPVNLAREGLVAVN